MLTNCRSCHYYSSDSPELGCTANPEYWEFWQSLKQSGNRLNQLQRLIISDCDEFRKGDNRANSLHQSKAVTTRSLSLVRGLSFLREGFIESLGFNLWEYLITPHFVFPLFIVLLLASPISLIITAAAGDGFPSNCTKNLTLYWQEKPTIYSIQSLGYENEPLALIYTDAATGQKRKIISPPPHEVSELICPK
jgi:hypothetical protein